MAVSHPMRSSHRPWGVLAAIDLHGCDVAALADPDCIRAFVSAMIEAIAMRAHGPLAVERFGAGDLEGWSGMQFIETSTITVHADEVGVAVSSTCSAAGCSTPSVLRRSPSSTSAARLR